MGDLQQQAHGEVVSSDSDNNSGDNDSDDSNNSENNTKTNNPDKITLSSDDNDVQEIKSFRKQMKPLKSPFEVLENVIKSKQDTEKRIEFNEKEVYRIKILKDQTDPNNTSRENLDYNFTQKLVHFAEDLLDMLEVKQKQVTELREAYVSHLAKSGLKHKELRRTEVLLGSIFR